MVVDPSCSAVGLWWFILKDGRRKGGQKLGGEMQGLWVFLQLSLGSMWHG